MMSTKRSASFLAAEFPGSIFRAGHYAGIGVLARISATTSSEIGEQLNHADDEHEAQREFPGGGISRLHFPGRTLRRHRRFGENFRDDLFRDRRTTEPRR